MIHCTSSPVLPGNNFIVGSVFQEQCESRVFQLALGGTSGCKQFMALKPSEFNFAFKRYLLLVINEDVAHPVTVLHGAFNLQFYACYFWWIMHSWLQVRLLLFRKGQDSYSSSLSTIVFITKHAHLICNLFQMSSSNYKSSTIFFK